MLRTIANWF